jgi:membrane-associated phospholipid phosphatase
MPQRFPQNRKVLPRLVRLEDRTQPAASAVIAFGADAGGLPYVRLFDPASNSQVRAFLAYDPSFKGGVHVAEADVNGDGIPDVVTAPGAGGGPHIKVFDGRTGALLSQFFAYAPSFAGGVSVAVGDVTGDGKPDIITGAGAGGGPHVRVFDLAGNLEEQFFAYDASFTGGVNVAVGDTAVAGKGDIITGAGAGGGPHVKVFDGNSGTTLASFFAYGAGFSGGVSVSAADLSGTGVADIITGAGPGGGPHVKVFNGTGGLQSQFFAFDAAFTGGVRVGADDVTGAAQPDIVVAAGLNGNARWRAFNATTLAKVADSTAFAFPFAGGVTVAGSTPEAITLANADAVVGWDAIALNAIRVDKTPPPKAARALAMMSAAVYNAVNAIVPLHAFYHDTPTLQPTADMTAAASQAAHDVLVSLFPAQTATFDAALATWLGKVPAGTGETAGVTLGQQTAANIIALRANDGANTTVTYTPGTNPGDWQPTPPANAPALLPQWPNVVPFAMTAGNEFRPAGPPALTSQAYADALNEVQAIGSATSTTRTADQTNIALFWADGGGTFTPPGHWNQISQDVSLLRGQSLAENAQMLFALNAAEADSGIAAWDAKFTYNFWRPVTSIRNAGADGNAATTADLAWTPLLVTPPFPSYMSGHSTFSAAASTVLSGFFGADLPFTDHGDPNQTLTRSFTSFTAAANEAGLSRIYGGIHYSFDNTDGLATGHSIGQLVVSSLLN